MLTKLLSAWLRHRQIRSLRAQIQKLDASAQRTELQVRLVQLEGNVSRDTAEKFVFQRTIRELQDREGSP